MHAEPTTGLRKLTPIQKAARLIAEDRVHLAPSARVYVVDGDHGVYRVLANEQGIFCSCAARSALCSHALAVMQVWRPEIEPADEALWRRVGAVA